MSWDTFSGGRVKRSKMVSGQVPEDILAEAKRVDAIVVVVSGSNPPLCRTTGAGAGKFMRCGLLEQNYMPAWEMLIASGSGTVC